MNITLDDTSPLFSYISNTHGWLTNHTIDTITPEYFDDTFHGTYTQDDMVELTFNGTAIYIYGAKRANHGLYSAQLDDGNTEYLYGTADTNLVQQVLYSAAGLSDTKEHTVRMIAKPGDSSPAGNATFQIWFDIDYAVITTATTGEVYTTTIDNTSPYITYKGTGTSWMDGPPTTSAYYNDTVHVTANIGDTFTLDFIGSSIQLFGGVDATHGNFTVNLDGVGQGLFNGTYFELYPRSTLYMANNLTDGPHTVVVENFGVGTSSVPGGNFLDFDYAVVNSTIDPNAPAVSNTTATNSTSTTIAASAASAAATSSAPTTKPGGSNTGAIAGGVVGGVVGLALLAVLAFFLFRRRRDNREYKERPTEGPNLTGDEVKPYPHSADPIYAATSSSTHGWGRNTNGVISPSARESDHTTTPFLTSLPPPPASNATSYPRSVAPPSSTDGPSPIETSSDYVNPFTGSGGPRSSAQGYNTSQGYGSTQGYSPSPMSSGQEYNSESSRSIPPRVPAKAAGVALPFTARQPAPSSSAITTSPTPTTPQRLHREGRDYDMGPVIRTEHEAHNLLPPDYHQATEPLPGQRPPSTFRSGSN